MTQSLGNLNTVTGEQLLRFESLYIVIPAMLLLRGSQALPVLTIESRHLCGLISTHALQPTLLVLDEQFRLGHPLRPLCSIQCPHCYDQSIREFLIRREKRGSALAAERALDRPARVRLAVTVCADVRLPGGDGVVLDTCNPPMGVGISLV